MYNSVLLNNLQVYSEKGWRIFPCHSRGERAKSPIERGWQDRATSDWSQIKNWFYQYPGCAWAVCTSAEMGVLDIDPRHSGDKTLAELEAKYGPLPRTLTVNTGSGGTHYYLRFPPGTGNKTGLFPGIDIRAERGLVIIPPSKIDIHESPYRWDKSTPLVIADAPAWLLENKNYNTSPVTESPWIVQTAEDLTTHPGSGEGTRHSDLCRLVGKHIARGDSLETILFLAENWSDKCSPPYADWERQTRGLWDKDQSKQETDLSIFQQPKQESKQPSVKNLILSDIAYHGLVGKILRAVEGETEAHPASLLLSMMTMFGNDVGRGAWFKVGGRKHHPILFVANAADTGDCKGEGPKAIQLLFEKIDPSWANRWGGISSGEGLVELVCDRIDEQDSDGKIVIVCEGAKEKRRLIRLSELTSCFKVVRRENATLSD